MKGQAMKIDLRHLRDHLAVAAMAAMTAATASTHEPGDRDDERGERHEESRIARGHAIVPPGVTLDRRGKNPALLGLGSYIVNTAGCNDCHTHPSYAPGGDPFQGQPEMIDAAQYLSGGRVFGPFT
jgi:hypothetical protein